MEKHNPKISIIIPIYNAERFIEKTLNSVVNQTLNDIEIICVNDCSVDHTQEILNRFALSDNRIRCIRHDTNAGEGAARKSGIMASSGDYIMFLDADDSLDIEACQELYQTILRKQVDMLQFGTSVVTYGKIDEDELCNLERFLKPYHRSLCSDQVGFLIKKCFVDHQFSYTVWNKIYKGDIVRRAVTYYENDRFDMGADLYLFFLIAFFSQSYASVKKKYYKYNFGAGITGGKSMTDKLFSANVKMGKIFDHLEVFLQKQDALNCCKTVIQSLKSSSCASIVYNWLHNYSRIDASAALEGIFEFYEPSTILSEILFAYANADYTDKKEIIRYLSELPDFSSKKRQVKTIGTFYFRMYDGGIERVLSLLLDMWNRMGYKVVLFTDEAKTPSDFAYPENIERVVLPRITKNEKEQHLARVTSWRNMLMQYDIDLMVYHAWVNPYLATDLLAIKSLQIPVVVHTHGMFAHAVSSHSDEWAFDSVFISKLFKLADAVVTLTNIDCSWWALLHPHVYKTVNPATFDIKRDMTAKLDSKNMLYLGRISSEKKIEELLKILKAVLDSGCTTELHLVGKCEQSGYLKQLKALIEELELGAYVKFHDYTFDVEEYYLNCGVYVMTSSAEGTPMTLIECMSLGVPAVVYDLPNVDVVREGKGLKVVPQNDVRGAAKAIVEILTNDEYRRDLGKEAKESIQKMYAIDLPQFWNRVFTETGGDLKYQVAEPQYSDIQNAVSIFVDSYLEGLENRGIVRTAHSGHPESYVEGMYRNGDLGFREIIKFTVAWLKFKINRLLNKG